MKVRHGRECRGDGLANVSNGSVARRRRGPGGRQRVNTEDKQRLSGNRAYQVRECLGASNFVLRRRSQSLATDTITLHPTDSFAGIGIPAKNSASVLYPAWHEACDFHEAFENLFLSTEALEDSFPRLSSQLARCQAQEFSIKVLPFVSAIRLRYCCRTARSAAAASPRRSAQLPPTALLRYTAALLRSVSLCYVLPALHRAASLLRCCRADSLLPLYSPSPSRMRLNQSLLDLEHSKTCSASCWSTCFLQHRCFLCVAPCCTAPSVSTVQSAWTLTSWGSSRSQERNDSHDGLCRSVTVVVSMSFTPAGCKNSLLVVPNKDRLRKATQARFHFPLSNCLVVCRCIGETAIDRRWQPLQALWLSPPFRGTHCFSVFASSKLFSPFSVLSLSLLSSPLASVSLSLSVSVSVSLSLSLSVSGVRAVFAVTDGG